jgi:hypothetical protein
VKIQKTSLTSDQELQLRKEAAASVEREMEVVHNPEVESWLNEIGQRFWPKKAPLNVVTCPPVLKTAPQTTLRLASWFVERG